MYGIWNQMNTYLVGMEHLAIFTVMKRLHVIVPKSYYNHIQLKKNQNL